MGEKGARQSAAGAEMAERLVDELEPLGDVTTKKMFGGYGVFLEGVMFSLVDSKGAAYLRADDVTSGRYQAAGSGKHGRMPYWRIPEAVLDEPSRLIEWAQEAAAVAKTNQKW